MENFERTLNLLKEYKDKHGDCLVPYSYITEKGIRLGRIVSHMRTDAGDVSPEEKTILDNIGFVWKVREKSCSFEEAIKLLQKYKEKHGDLLIPYSYITEDGIRLGQMVNNIRTGARKTSSEEKTILDNIGFVWKIQESYCSFGEVIKLLKKYKEKHGDCLVPYSYITEDGIRLGRIVSTIRSGHRKITSEEKAILDSMGFVWKVIGSHLSFVQIVILLKRYKEKYGNCLVSRSYITEDGVYLGKIVDSIRSGTRKTTTEQKDILNSIGFVWRVQKNG